MVFDKAFRIFHVFVHECFEPVRFWAVGTNCCGRRSKFSCDASANPGQGGIVRATESEYFKRYLDYANDSLEHMENHGKK